MSKKLSRKLLSIVLVLAICITTVFGCLMTVTAAEPYADDGTYTITVGDENGAVPMGSVKVPAQVKFDFEGGFLGGEFTVDNTAGNYASVTDVKVVAATDFNGNAASVENFGIYQEDFLIGFFDESQYFKSITLEYTLNLGTDSNGQIYVGTGKAIAIDIIPNKAAFGIPAGDEFVFEITETEDSMSQFHAHGAWNDDTVTYQKDGKHHVGRGNCTVCQNTLGLPYQEYSSVQIIPDYTEFDDVTATIKSAEGWVGVSGVNVTYNTDGSIDINVHAYRHWGGKPSYLIVTDLDGNELYRTQAYDDAAQSTYVADKGGVLGNKAKMFTLAGLSMQDFADGFLFTLCTIDGTNLRHSKSVKFSLRDYALSVVDENATWPEGTPDEQIELDKRIAAALCYYGASIDPEVFKSITDESGKVEGPKGEEGEGGSTATGHVATDTWDGTYDDEIALDSDGTTYLITNAEELAWIALQAGDATNGKKYKVADNQVFDLSGMSGITLNSTSAEVKTATKDAEHLWMVKMESDWTEKTYFQGDFDGNGLVVYNMATTTNATGGGCSAAGLFPYAKPATGTATQTIENVSVHSSFIIGYNYTAGIVGMSKHGGSGGNATTAIKNCEVVNCHISDNNNSNTSTQQKAAGIVAQTEHNKITIDNCIVKNNDISAGKVNSAFVAVRANLSYGTTQINNSIAIGTTPISSNETTTITFNNVYTDQAASASGITQLSDFSGKNCSALDFTNIWFANGGAPVLRVFHDFSEIVDLEDGTHAVKCSVCGLAGVAEPHSYGAPNGEGVASCACGVTKKSHVATDVWSGTIPDSDTTQLVDGYYIIETPEQLAWVALKGGDNTLGKKYKVADNQIFNLNGFTGITLNSTSADVEAATPTGKVWTGSAIFRGDFDGNGLVVYNMMTSANKEWSSENTGLFPLTKAANGTATLTIKNVSVCASYSDGRHYAGGIVGRVRDMVDTQRNSITVFENCSVTNSHIGYNGANGSAYNERGGGIAGDSEHAGITIKNCLVADNNICANKISGGFVGNKTQYGQGIIIENSIVIGYTPEVTTTGGLTYTNVYTDQTITKDGITVITDMSGKNCSALDFTDIWFANDGAPVLRVFHNIAIADNGDGTHSEACSGCELKGDATAHTYATPDYAAGTTACACGAKVVGIIDTWDGTNSKPTKIDGDYTIIENAEQLAWVALEGGDDTLGKKYKVVPMATFNLNGFTGITLNSTSADVEAATPTGKVWTGSAIFRGDFDGNGLVVYNMMTSANKEWSSENTGLFPLTKAANGTATLTIKNVSVCASYSDGRHYAGGIVGRVRDMNDTQRNSITVFENCSVTNSHIGYNGANGSAYNERGGGITSDSEHAGITIKNCLVADNNICANKINGGFVGNKTQYGQGIIIENSIVIGYTPEVTTTGGLTYTNVYTDQTITKDGITVLTDLSGKACANLDFNKVWFANDGAPVLRVFYTIAPGYNEVAHYEAATRYMGTMVEIKGAATAHSFTPAEDGVNESCACGYTQVAAVNVMNKLPTNVQAILKEDQIFLTSFESNTTFLAAYKADNNTSKYADPVYMYGTSLNLKSKPYIIFTFAISDQAMWVSENISFSFTSTNGYTKTVKASEATHNDGAGRYHTVRLKDIPTVNMRDYITVTANYNGTEYQMGTYSAAGFAINAIKAGAAFKDYAAAAKGVVYYSELLAERLANVPQQ